MWDTWLVEREGLFYLFYIRLPRVREPSGPAPTLGPGWDGISLATSSDLLHWTEHGPVLEKSTDAAWLGTGMVHRVGERFVMNYSEERPPGCQTICFATSDDLRRWVPLSRDHDLRADGRIYQADVASSTDPLPRWDSIGVVPPARPGESYFGVIAANSCHQVLPGQCAVLGMLSSDDGLHWVPRPPGTAPGLFPNYEVAEHVEISGRHYVLFSTNTTAGARFVPGDPLPQGGTYYVVSDQRDGPYVRPPVHPMLHGHRIGGREFGVYVGRPITTSGGELLFYHHWTADPPEAWWGPPKRLVERGPYVLGLDYWPGCEALKEPASGEHLGADAVRPLPPTGAVAVVSWAVDNATLVSTNAGGAHGAHWADAGPPGRGRIIETQVRIDAGRGLGLWAQYRDSPSMVVVSLNSDSQRLELGTIFPATDNSSLNFHVEELVDWPLAKGVPHHVRLLVRHSFLEVYIDERLAKSFVCRQRLEPSKAGFFSDLADGRFLKPRHWLMSL
jgi:hypothetical protein